MRPTVHPTAHVDPSAQLGDGVSVGPYTLIGPRVELGARSRVDSHCIIGHTEPGRDPLPLRIGEDAAIRSHAVIYGGSTIGTQFETGHHVAVREGMTIGLNFRLGNHSDMQGPITVGDYVRVHSSVIVGEHAELRDFVWVLPYTVIASDPHPPSDGHYQGVVLEAYVVVSAGCTLLPGVRIGRDSLVGAHTLVSRDVRPGSVVTGVPARDRGDASRIALPDGSPAYPWRRHFHRGYPDTVVSAWDGVANSRKSS